MVSRKEKKKKRKRTKENRRVQKKKKKYRERISFFRHCSRKDETGICFKASWQKWGKIRCEKNELLDYHRGEERRGWNWGKMYPVTGVNTGNSSLNLIKKGGEINCFGKSFRGKLIQVSWQRVLKI